MPSVLFSTVRRWQVLACIGLLAGCGSAASADAGANGTEVAEMDEVAPAIMSGARAPFPSGDSSIAQIASTEAALTTHWRELRNVSYADISPAQRFDLWLPARGEGPFPLVVWIHGGGWERGDRHVRHAAPTEYLLNSGFAVASIDYRLSSEAVFPAQLVDVKAAVRHLRANSASYVIDPYRIALWGESAGGHLAALAGTTSHLALFDDARLGNVGVSSRVQAIVDFYGPVSFTTFDRDSQAAKCDRRIAAADSTASRLIGAPVGTNLALAERASPITYVSAEAPPFFIQHGRADCMVPWQQSDALAKALRAKIAPASVQTRFFDNEGHGGASFTSTANLEQIVGFLKSSLG